MTGHDYVTYFGDFEDAYRRSDGDECGYLVPEHLIRRREAAERELQAANAAIRAYIDDNDVPEVDLTEHEHPAEPGGLRLIRRRPAELHAPHRFPELR